jgi:hypothetical protein
VKGNPQQNRVQEVLGYTGTRHLIEGDEALLADIVVRQPKGIRVITGGCVGVDAVMARLHYTRGDWVHIILPWPTRWIDPDWRKYCNSWEQAPNGPEPYRIRNTMLVAQSYRIIGIPEFDEVRSPRSGTWMTIRIARKVGKAPIVQTLEDQRRERDAILRIC